MVSGILYVDYMRVKKACLKDLYPLPPIDQLVDATVRYPVLSFLDAYSGYHQIFVDAKDSIKTTFIIGDTVYYYVYMPFGLNNAGASFQRVMTKVLSPKLSETLKLMWMTSSSKAWPSHHI